MKQVKNKKPKLGPRPVQMSLGFGRPVLFALVGATIVGLAAIGWGAFRVMTWSTSGPAGLAEMADQADLALKLKGQLLAPMLLSENTIALQEGLNCLSLITGEKPGVMLQALADHLQNPELAAKARSIAATFPIAPASSGDSISGLMNCYAAWQGQG